LFFLICPGDLGPLRRRLHRRRAERLTGPRGANRIEGILEYSSISRRAFEAIAELRGIELDYDLHLPEPELDFLDETALGKLTVDIEHLPVSEAFLPWERELLGAIPKFLPNRARYRRWFEFETLADITRVTGERHDSVAAADEALRRSSPRTIRLATRSSSISFIDGS